MKSIYWILGGVALVVGYVTMKRLARPTLDNPTPDFTDGYKTGLGDATDGRVFTTRAGKSSDWLYGYEDGYRDGIGLPV